MVRFARFFVFDFSSTLFSGVKYLNDCPIESYLPIYLLVIGSMGLVRILNLLWKQFRRRRLRKLEGIELDQEEETENGEETMENNCLKVNEKRFHFRSF